MRMIMRFCALCLTMSVVVGCQQEGANSSQESPSTEAKSGPQAKSKQSQKKSEANSRKAATEIRALIPEATASSSPHSGRES